MDWAALGVGGLAGLLVGGLGMIAALRARRGRQGGTASRNASSRPAIDPPSQEAADVPEPVIDPVATAAPVRPDAARQSLGPQRADRQGMLPGSTHRDSTGRDGTDRDGTDRGSMGWGNADRPGVVSENQLRGDLVQDSIDALRVGLVVLACDGTVLLANPAARRLGLVRAEATPDARLPADPAGRHQQLAAHSVLRTLGGRITRPGQQRDVDLELNRRDLPGAATDGPDRFGVRVHLVGLAGGHVAMEAEDVTEAHRVARVRRDFVANVSHELKTPVGALQLLGEALVDALDDPDAARRFAERIAHESGRLGRLVTELLELSRLQGAEPLPDPVPVGADRLVAEVLDRTRTTAQAKQIGVVAGGEHGLTVYGNETQLATALANLVENALAYSPEHTTITVRADRHADTVLLSVVDQGIGIEPRDLDRIFERFYRADKARSRATGGTGLGLAIVKHIATNHGGRVDVSSTVGAGSTFTLRLPGRPPRDIALEHNPGEIAEDIGQAEVQPGAPVRRP